MEQQRQISLQAGNHTPKLLGSTSLTIASAKDDALLNWLLCHASSWTHTHTSTAGIQTTVHALPFPDLCWQLSVSPNMQTVIFTFLFVVGYY